MLVSKGECFLLLCNEYPAFLIAKQCSQVFSKLVTLAREKNICNGGKIIRGKKKWRNSGLLRSVRRRMLAFPEQVKDLMSLAINLTWSPCLASHLSCSSFPLTPALRADETL